MSKEAKTKKPFPETIKQVDDYERQNIGNPAVNFPIEEEWSHLKTCLERQQHPTPNVPLIALNEAAEKDIFQKEAESCYTTSESNYYRNTDGCNNAEIINEQEAFVNGAEFGANYERSKLPQLIKEVLKRAADQMTFIYHDGFNKTDNRVIHAQFGIDHVRIDKQSILNINCDDLIK